MRSPSQHDTGAWDEEFDLRSAFELVIRWLVGAAGVYVLALCLLYDVHNAQTVVEEARDRALADGRWARAHSWGAAGCCALVITATAYRVLSRSRRPRAWLLWLGGAASVWWSVFVWLVTMSIFT